MSLAEYAMPVSSMPASSSIHRSPVLALRNITKTFGGAQALRKVQLTVTPGSVHGLLGRNGSGKSTLVKILAGFHEPDEGGELQFNGERLELPLQPGDFRRIGMSFVHQRLGLVPSLTVLENLRFASLSSSRKWKIDWREEEKRAAQALERFHLPLRPGQRVDSLTPVERALLAIVRAFEDIQADDVAEGHPGLLVLDEPTPFLPKEGVDQLFGLVRSITMRGSSVVFISHSIDEVMQITDQITVLRDGVVAGELTTGDATHDEVVEMIVGRSMARAPRVEKTKCETSSVFARLSNVAGKMLKPTSIDLRKGEILGLTGLIGSGYEEVPYLVFGARRGSSGGLQLEEAPPIDLTSLTPAKAIQLNFALLPGDRQTASGVDSLGVMDNLFLPDLARFFRKGRLDYTSMKGEARRIGMSYEVRPNDPHAKLSTLSGGNAQKVLLARWMNRAPRLLLLDEPMQGVDIGTCRQLAFAIRAAAEGGMSIVCASTDAEQLAEICDRVLVFAQGQICRELSGDEISKETISAACYASAAF